MLALINKIKRKLKLTLPIDGAAHKLLKSIYNSAIFPLERRAWRRVQASGFSNAASLHMCSLIPIRTLDAVIEAYQPESWLDAGCGTGASLEYILRKGISAAGLEFSDLAVIESGLEKYITQCSLTRAVDLGEVFDVVWCYEVAEHLPESGADQLVKTLAAHGNRIVFSAARPGQGGLGHINEQNKAYWQQKFESNGCSLDKKNTIRINNLKELFSDNVMCFYKEESQNTSKSRATME